MKILVIPDVHLKPWMFLAADNIMNSGAADGAVCLMDIADDWGKGYNIELYARTFEQAIEFHKRFPTTMWCYGNHDVSYLWEQFESGYSSAAQYTVAQKVRELRETVANDDRIGYLLRVDNLLFSHGGLSMTFVKRIMGGEISDDIDAIIKATNSLDVYSGSSAQHLWRNDSPLWLRPQGMARLPVFNANGIIQVVGHTPVERIYKKNGIVSCDVFSTWSDGTPIGTEEFPIIDSVTGEFRGVSGKE